MSGSAGLRAVTASAVASVLGIAAGKNASLDRVLRDPAMQPDSESDGPRFRAWCYEVLRSYHRAELMLAELLDKPLRRRDLDIHSLLTLAVIQLCEPGAAEHAIVSESVNAASRLRKPRMKGLINAVLRRFIDHRASLIETADRGPVGQYSHPGWLIEALQNDWPDQWQEILGENNKQAPMWLRINRRKNTREKYSKQLLNESITVREDDSLLSADALCLQDAVDVEKLPGFGSGSVSVQDAAAQLAAHLINVQPGMRVLDACAAPGGKTCHMLELVDNDLDLHAVDSDRTRLDRVHENLRRLDLDATTVHADAGDTADWWDGECFHRILLDVPCSATGVIRRHPDIKILRRASDISALVDRQAALLVATWPLLARGGFLLYASCSTLRAENMLQIKSFLKNQKDAELSGASDSLINHIDECLAPRPSGPGLQLLPGQLGADGFFYALIKKRD